MVVKQLWGFSNRIFNDSDDSVEKLVQHCLFLMLSMVGRKGLGPENVHMSKLY